MSQELSEFDTHVSRRYEMEKRLGRGAYGIVWKAKSKRSGRVVESITICVQLSCIINLFFYVQRWLSRRYSMPSGTKPMLREPSEK